MLLYQAFLHREEAEPTSSSSAKPAVNQPPSREKAKRRTAKEDAEQLQAGAGSGPHHPSSRPPSSSGSSPPEGRISGTSQNDSTTSAPANGGHCKQELDPTSLIRMASLGGATSHAKRPSASLISGSVKKDTAIATHLELANVHPELSPEKVKAIRKLYDRLDMDNDGTIDIRDLTVALQHEVPHIPSRLAPQILERISTQKGVESVNFSQFLTYVVEHEKKLESLFNELDKNKDGYVDQRELNEFCQRLGRPISEEKVVSIVKQMDESGKATVEKFLEYMLLVPSGDPSEMIDFWRHNLVIDIGEDLQVPEDFTPAELATGVWWRHLVAGGVAGCMSRTATAPLDRIKVFLQVNSTRQTPFSLCSSYEYLRNEGGVPSFWRGNGINVLKIAPESAFKFMFYEQIKRFIQRLKGTSELTTYERFIAGSSAGAISQSIIYPLEVLKTRLALRKTGDLRHGLSHFAREMYKKEGLRCFYKGYLPNLVGIIPYAGIDLAVYETLKKAYTARHPHHHEPGIPAVLLCGTVSSTTGQLMSYPFALVRTKLQARTGADSSQPATMRGQLRQIYVNEGFPGLYRGIVPNFLKVIPAVSISYVVYEWTRKKLGATMT